MKKLFYILFFLLAFNSLDAQGWYKFYDQYPSSIIRVVTQLPNEQYIISGTIDPGMADELFLALVENDGDIIIANANYTLRMKEMSTIVQTDDGGVVILGSMMNPTEDLAILKFDGSLNLEWKKMLPSLGSQEKPKELMIDPDGNFMVHGIWNKNQQVVPVFARLDQQGNIIWHNLGHEAKSSSGIAFDSNGNIATTGMTPLGNSKVYIGIYDIQTGIELNYLVYDSNPYEKENGFELITGTDGHFFLFSRYELYDSNFDKILDSKIRIRELGPNGNIISQNDLQRDILEEEFVGAIRLEDGTFTYCFRSHESAARYYVQLVHIASDMATELWSKEFPDISPEIELAYDFIQTIDGGYLVSGTVAEGEYIPFLLKVDDSGVAFSNEISGYVFHDISKDCQYNQSELYLAEWMVEIQGNDQVYYRMTDANGYYSIDVDAGDYQVRVVPPSDVWVECPAIPVSFDGYFLSTDLNAPIQSLFDCPVLSVDISTGTLRRCYERNYDVQYCNLGTQNANGVYIEVEIDSQLVITNTTLPITSQDGNKLTFDIGNVPYNDCGTFRITVFTPCNVTLGDIHCSTAHIYPDVVCDDATSWTGAEVKVVGECIDNNSIHFEIQNIGGANMTVPRLYNVIEDEVVLMTGNFELNAGEVMPIILPANGGVYRLEAEQEINYPTNSSPSVIVPGCGGFFDSSYMNWYPMDDDELFYDISCMENVDSYDPNDKQATPQGYDEEHYIEANTDLEYQIRFQNTGTDDAYHVVVLDTLSPDLDVSTFRLGTSSFPCNVQILSSGNLDILKFEFLNINLTPFIYDEANSSGYVKFNISQQKNLPIGTVIENEASIYFDFNDPIVTNRTYHTIGTDFMVVDLIIDNTIEEVPILNIAVTPNPLTDKATFTLGDLDEGATADFTLYSVDGKLVRLGQFRENVFVLERGNLSYGMYLFSIKVSNGETYRGKLLIR